MSLKNELELELQLDAYAQPAAEAAQEAQAAAQTARSAAQEADTAEQAAQAAAQTAETAAAGADAAAETANAAAQAAQQATEETRLATQSTISAVTYAQEMAYQVGETGRQVQTIGYDAQDAAQEARDAAADARDAALGVWKKADAILDESAQAKSHTLYAQGDYPLTVTVHGAAGGVSNFNDVLQLDGNMTFDTVYRDFQDVISFYLASVSTLVSNCACAAGEGRYAEGGFAPAGAVTQLGNSEEDFQYAVVDKKPLIAVKRSVIGAPYGTGEAAAKEAILAYFTEHPKELWVKTTDGTRCAVGIILQGLNGSMGYTERYHLAAELDAPLEDGETASVDIRKPESIVSALTVRGTAKMTVTYAHDTKHYIDSQIAAAVALALNG